MPYKDPEKQREASRKWNAAHPEKRRAANHKWSAAHPEKVRDRHLAMAAAQHGQCAICRRGDRVLCVDHNHVTGTVRGLICQKCNSGIGMLCDSPDILRGAADYLEKE
jgi:hypothetical protein